MGRIRVGLGISGWRWVGLGVGLGISGWRWVGLGSVDGYG